MMGGGCRLVRGWEGLGTVGRMQVRIYFNVKHKVSVISHIKISPSNYYSILEFFLIQNYMNIN